MQSKQSKMGKYPPDLEFDDIIGLDGYDLILHCDKSTQPKIRKEWNWPPDAVTRLRIIA